MRSYNVQDQTEQISPKKMKKLAFTLVLAIGYCFSGFSQSNNGTISGYFTVILGQSSTFTVNTSEEVDAFKWEINNNLTNNKNKKSLGILKAIGNTNERILTVEPTSLGTFSVQVVYTTKNGYQTASFIGNVVNPTEITTEKSITLAENTKNKNK